MSDWLPSVVSILVVFLGSGAGWFLLSHQRRKLEAESTDIISGAAVEVVKALKVEVADLRETVGKLETEMRALKAQNALLQCEIDDLRRGARRLQGQIEALGQPPVWTVPPITQEPA